MKHFCLHIQYIYKPNKHFNVVSTLFLGWYDVAKSDNIKSTLKQRCARLCLNLQLWITPESMLFISTLIWTTLGNVEATLSLSTSIYTTLNHVETMLQIWSLKMKNKLLVKNIIILSRFNENNLNWVRWTQNFLYFVSLFMKYM